MSELFAPSIEDQISCVEREIALRGRVYARQVAAQRMSQKFADYELTVMRAVLDTLRAVRRAKGNIE